MLAGFGVSARDAGVGRIVLAAIGHRVNDLFAVRGTVPTRAKRFEPYAKPDPYADLWSVSPSNSPIDTYALIARAWQKNGMLGRGRRARAADALAYGTRRWWS